ncbi:MAG: hypothetical protein JSV27_03840 [Candidatus Bathyarchaeota archaeon]|nr:MAG: hypothetical protein JSV27_03840 [Candidatus Bathyarchaeota archaeon]
MPNERQETLKEKLRELMDQLLSPSEVELDDIKKEIWEDLSALYYKYEAEDQKRAFREVMYEITDRINKGKWDSVYKRIYRQEQKSKTY